MEHINFLSSYGLKFRKHIDRCPCKIRDKYTMPYKFLTYIDGLVQERRNSIANTLELYLSCSNRWVRARKT